MWISNVHIARQKAEIVSEAVECNIDAMAKPKNVCQPISLITLLLFSQLPFVVVLIFPSRSQQTCSRCCCCLHSMTGQKKKLP